MKTIWTGSISFGLVNIPVRLYSAVESQNKVGFRLLHKKDNVPIKNKRWCSKHDKEVSWDDIVKGIEISKNKFYIFEKEELQNLKPGKTDTINIVEIIHSRQIDPIYFDHTYFIGPDKKNEKAYFLLKEVLQQSAKAAIGRFVMREKEYVCAIESYKNGLLLTTLNYAYEIRNIEDIDFIDNKPKLSTQELELAKQLIGKLEKEEFDITDFKDTFRDELLKLIKKKTKGELIEVKAESKKIKKEKNLVESLKASL
ncbi:MAG: Ku protein [Candidatus Woesearchaeota archaeon]|jgi:DNA end-binding protein Ku